MRHLQRVGELIKVFLLASGFVLMLASCGTQVGNPTEPDERTQKDMDKPQNTQSSERPDSLASQSANTDIPVVTTAITKTCIVSVTSKTLNPGQLAGLMTIDLLPAGDFKAFVTPPGQDSIEGKALSMPHAGVYKIVIVPAHGPACSAQITIDSDLMQKFVSATVTLP